VGIRTLTVSNDADADVARAFGFEVAFRTPPETADAAVAFGLDGVHRPVMTAAGEFIAAKRVPAGAGVSYGYTFRTPRSTTLGLVGLGYADGIPRLGSNRAEVGIAGVRYPLVGRIAMDQFVVDVGDAVVAPGAEVVIFGDPRRGEPSAREWAEWTERSALALAAGLGDRIRREVR
jgi:alanine racemase